MGCDFFMDLFDLWVCDFFPLCLIFSSKHCLWVCDWGWLVVESDSVYQSVQNDFDEA